MRPSLFLFKLIDSYFLQPQTGKLLDGINLDHFTLKCSNKSLKLKSFSGNYRFNRSGYFYIHFPNDEIMLRDIARHCLTEKFDIFFHENRRTFLFQHMALDMMKQDQIFRLLINNEQFKLPIKQIEISDELW